MLKKMMMTAKMQSLQLHSNVSQQQYGVSTENLSCCPRSCAKICIAPSKASNLKLLCGSSRNSVRRVRAILEEKKAPSTQGAKTVKVKLELHTKCEFGNYFSVVGDNEILGAWNPEASLPMQWSDGDIWTSELELSVGRRIEFKFLLKGRHGVIEWQPGPNRVFEASKSLTSSVVFESWSSQGSIIHDEIPNVHTLDLENEGDVVNVDIAINSNTPVQTSDTCNGSLLTADLQCTNLVSESIISDALNDPKEVKNVGPAVSAKDVNGINEVKNENPSVEAKYVNDMNEEDINETKDQLISQDAWTSKNQRRNARRPSLLEKDLEWGRQMLSRFWGGLIQNPEDTA